MVRLHTTIDQKLCDKKSFQFEHTHKHVGSYTHTQAWLIHRDKQRSEYGTKFMTFVNGMRKPTAASASETEYATMTLHQEIFCALGGYRGSLDSGMRHHSHMDRTSTRCN